MPIKLFRCTTTVPRREGPPSHFVDWYETEDEDSARRLHYNDCARYGLPLDRQTLFVECDRRTLKPT